jgi:hypothetical protein
MILSKVGREGKGERGEKRWGLLRKKKTEHPDLSFELGPRP